MPKGIATVLALALSLLAALPAAAREEKARQDCLNDRTKSEERITACTRYLRAGQPTVDEQVAALAARGEAFRDLKRYDEALADFDGAIALQPDKAFLYQKRGLTQDWKGDDEAALADYDRAIALDPDDAWSYYARGSVLKQLKRLDEALEAFDRALAVSPDYLTALRARGDTNRQRKDWGAARDDYNRVLALRPYSDYDYNLRGEVHEHLARPFDAARDYLISLRLYPNSDQVQWKLDDLGVDIHRATETPSRDFTFAPPPVGLAIVYLQQEVTPESQVEVDPMEEAIGELASWFAGPKEVPLPLSSIFITRQVTATEGRMVTLDNAVSFPASDAATRMTDRAKDYLDGLWPASFPTPQGEGAAIEYDEAALAQLWTRAPGKGASGTGKVVVHCPPEGVQPDLIAAVVGCQPEQTVEIGSLTWSAKVEGWQAILTPAGRFPALRLRYEESATLTLMGQTKTRTAVTTWWWSPDVHWWVKRKVEKDGKIEVSEAVSIRR